MTHILFTHVSEFKRQSGSDSQAVNRTVAWSWSFTTFSVGGWWVCELDEIKAISSFNQVNVKVEA